MSFTSRVKRSLIGVAAGAMVLSLMPAGAALAGTAEVCANAEDAGFTDVTADGTHSDNINCMSAYGVGQGLTDGSYGVYQNLSRGQAASLLVAFAVAATDGAIADDVDETIEVPFEDIAGGAHEANIEILYRLGLIAGTSETTFSPSAAITRGQFATILRNAHVALGVDFAADLDPQFDDVEGTTHEEAINQLAAADIINGVSATMYAPNDFVTRGQTASLLALSAGVLDDAGLWLASRLGTNQTFTVTPSDAATVEHDNSVDTDTPDDDRSYTVTDTVEGATHTVALFPADEVSVDQDGVVTFNDDDNDGEADGYGDVDAVISTIQNQTASGTSVDSTVPVNGVITFSIDGAATEDVVPVVYFDDEGPETDLDIADDTLFGVGGTTNFVPPEAPNLYSETTVEVLSVDADGNSFVADDGTDSYTFFYDSSDTFEIDEEVGGNLEITLDDFEAALTPGDELDIDYNDSASLESFFEIEADVPDAPTGLTASVSGSDVTFSWTASTGAFAISSYTVGIDANCDDDGTYTDVEESTTDDSTELEVTGLPAGDHCAVVTATSTSDFTPDTSEDSEPVDFTVEGPAGPTIESSELTDDAIEIGTVDTGDEWTFVFSENLDAIDDGDQIWVTDDDGDQIRLEDDSATDGLAGTGTIEATFSLTDDTLVVTLAADPSDIDAAGDGEFNYPVTVTTTAGITASGVEADLDASADLVVE